jgi:hypothetical protein
VAWYLDPSPRDFTKPGFMNSKPREPLPRIHREGVAGTSMPPWKRSLKDEQINGVLDYVMQNFVKEPAKELKARNIPEKNPGREQRGIHRGGRADLRTALQRAATAARPMARVRTRSISSRTRATCGIHFFVESVADRGCSNRLNMACRERPCRPGSIWLSTNEVGDVVNFIRSFQNTPK